MAGPITFSGVPADSLPCKAFPSSSSRSSEPIWCGTVQTQEGPTAFFVTFTVQGQPVRALFDSGSSRTFLGPLAIQWLDKLGVPRTSCRPRGVEMAGGQRAIAEEVVNPVVCLNGSSFRLTAYLLPVLVLPCILGLDFMRAAFWVVDFASARWFSWFEPQRIHTFETEMGPPTAHYLCRGLRELTTAQTRALKDVVRSEIPPAPEKPGCTSLTEHHIDVGGHPAIKQRYYAVSPAIEKAIHEAVQQMLSDGIIEPSSSDWSSPIVMVKKASGKLRFCLDFRKVNSVTKKDAYPIPLMNSILDRLRQANYITTLDLSQAYFQIPLAADSREITAFTVPGMGLYQFRRMPFGLTNAPATFQRLLDRLIGPEMQPHVYVYLDDIIIVTPTFDEHVLWLRRVLTKIRNAGLTINPDKSEFCRPEVKYLGFLVNREGLQIDPDKVAPVVNYPAPRNVKQLRRFLGMASWYRRFIPSFATLASPLTYLLKKSTSWVWDLPQRKAFGEIRTRLSTSPTLSCPNFELPFVLQTDASSVGLGAVLTQNVDGVEHVIAYASRALIAAERNYTTTEQECLAVLWSVRKFRCYLEGYHFTVITDHSSLRWLHNLKNPSGRLGRWALELQEYDYLIVHRKGALHHVPDALSRIPEDTCSLIVPVARSKDRWYNQKLRSVRRSPDQFPDWRVQDGRLYYHRPPRFPALEVGDLEAWKLVLPSELRQQALFNSHDVPQAGHLGVEKTLRRLSLKYYWPNMLREVANYVRKCAVCQRCKVEQAVPVGLMGKRILEQPWDTIAGDIMGPLPTSKNGFAYVLVLQDLFSKWIEIAPLRKATGKRIAEAVEDLIACRWGTPRVFLTDNGTEFVNRDIRALTERLGILHHTIAPYHPQANPVERVNRVLKTMIVSYLGPDHREWDVHLPSLRFAFNTAHHTSTQSSPAYLNSDANPYLPTALSLETNAIYYLAPRPCGPSA